MQRRILLKSSILCLGMFGLVNATFAEDVAENRDKDVFSLGEIVVADTTGVQDIAVNNTVTAEQIERLGATTAAEALKYVPGVNVVQTTKGEAAINIQGFKQSDVLILVDGVPYYETKNGYLDLNQIPSSIISKIVVTKGASSVLYGPNALGGVVNIITKKGVEGFNGNVRSEIGGDGYNRDVATLNYGAGNGFSALGTIDYKRRDAVRFSDDHEPVVSEIKPKGEQGVLPNNRVIDSGGKKDNTDLESLNLWTRLGYAPTEEAEVYASIYRFELERGRPFSDSHNKVFWNKNGVSDFSTFGRYDSYEDLGVDLGGRVQTNDWLALRAMAFYHWHQDEFTSYQDERLLTEIATSTWKDDSYGTALFSDMDLNDFGNMSLSAQYKEDKHKDRAEDFDPFADSKSTTLSLAGEDTIVFGQFTGVAGVAWHSFDVVEVKDNEDGYSESTIDPMMGLTWTGENGLRLFGSIAKKTRFASFADMENDGNIFRVDPQKNINYTLGSEYTFFDRTNVVVSGFYNDIKDLFGDDVDGNPTNIGKAEFYGVELTTKTEISERWNLGLDYTWTHARNTSDDAESEYVEDVPEHSVGASLGYRIPYLEADASLRGLWRMDNYIVADVDGEESEDSFVLDFSLSKKLDNGVTLSGHLNNLLDEDFYEADGIASDGFSFKLIAQYDF